MSECAICKDEYESYQINGLGCCSTKYCNMCYDHVVKVLPKCSVCKKPNRHYKSQGKTVDELILSEFPDSITPICEITYDFDWFKNEFTDGCDKNKDDRFDKLINIINLIEEDQGHTHNVVREFSFIIEIDNESGDGSVEIDYSFQVNDKSFSIKSRYVPDFDELSQCERKYLLLGGIVGSFKGSVNNDGIKMLEALLA